MTATADRVSYDAEDLNTAPPLGATAGHFLTPTGLFFSRSHAPPPVVDLALWRLRVEGLVRDPLALSLEDIQSRYQRRELVSTMVCAGLRRSEFYSLGPLPGELPWGPEPASTGRWTGVLLADVLREAGWEEGARFVEFTGLDQVERHGRRFGFGGSVTLEKALVGNVLLAWALNGEPLPVAHGFPLRAVVPGWIGARSVKWLDQIILSTAPSVNYFQSEAYRVQRTADPGDPRSVIQGEAMSESGLNAVILDPSPGQQLSAGPTRVRGWAIGFDAEALAEVEVSPDDGVTWFAATITVPGERWTWTLWEATCVLAPGMQTIVVRARDRTGREQPARIEETWNVKGYGNNAWHRVGVVAGEGEG